MSAGGLRTFAEVHLVRSGCGCDLAPPRFERGFGGRITYLPTYLPVPTPEAEGMPVGNYRVIVLSCDELEDVEMDLTMGFAALWPGGLVAWWPDGLLAWYV